MSGFYTDDAGALWTRFGPWTKPLAPEAQQWRSDWIHAAVAAETPYKEITIDGRYELHVQVNDALRASPFFPSADTPAAAPAGA